MQKILTGAMALAVLSLAACGGSNSPQGNDDDGGGATPTCASPSAPAATSGSLLINSPSDVDPSTDPAPTTTIFYTVLTPARCPGASYPLVLHSHGYGGSKLTALAANGDLQPAMPHFPSIDALAQALPYHGYVVISFDERGHGESTNANARLIDPALETQDARALLDWAYDHAADYGIQRETGTGIDKDLKVGTLGYSYGGAFQMPLAALDARIDTIVPNGTWHGLLYSLLPGDSVKLGFGGLLGLLATTGGVSNTPIVQTAINTIGVTGAQAYNVRSRADLVAAVAKTNARPRPLTEAEMIALFDTHGMSYFRRQQKAGASWGFGESSAKLRKVPALFLQGNRDVLFNVTEAYWNRRYFSEAGGDVRLITTEGGHMNPLANQIEGTANCGGVVGVAAVLGWFDHYLKGVSSTAYDSLPKICISVADTSGAPDVPAAGVIVDEFPVGSLSGNGAVPAKLESGTADVAAFAIAPTFLPVTTISGNDKVLAGAPTLARIVITRGAPVLATQSTNGFVGVGILRAGASAPFLVDDQLTPFTEGEHVNNRGIAEDDRILLPSVGEQLKDGDQVGLLFYPQHVQYAAIVSGEGIAGLTGIISFISGVPIPPVTSALEPVLGLIYLNPYSAAVSDVQLPIMVPGTYSGSRLTQ
jgi:ABC-2 type transport system ATP-binding protein